MEQYLKKKTKKLIALKTNNFIQTQIEKQLFFNEVLQSLQSNFQQEQFQFLTKYLLSHQTNNHKRQKYEFKNQTQKRIMTQPQQKPFNLVQIDINLFHQDFGKKGKFMIKRNSENIEQKDFNCINTPKRKLKKIVFQNKRLLDLDRKLQQKYLVKKKNIVYEPHFLFTSNKKQEKNYLVSATYQSSFKKRINDNQSRKLRTNYSKTRNETLNNERSSPFQNENTFRRSEVNFTQRGNQKQKFIPQELMKKILLGKNQVKQGQREKQFSDLKISSKYWECFR